MRILTRYLLRAHAGPFLFAITALTGLLFLNSVAQRLDDLVGKGLGWDIIWDFLVLTLPHTVALTLPMAVLVAVLYAFSELTAHNEIMAMKAGGLRPQRIMLPLLVMGAVAGGVMFYFNNNVLPEANHELRNLLNDVGRKTPTLELREQVVNPITTVDRGTAYYLSAERIDDRTSRLWDVAIYDLANPSTTRTIFAERAEMAFNADQTDLYLTLFEGVTLESKDDAPGEFRQQYFERQNVPLRGVGNTLERMGAGDRGDREMTVAMLDSAAAARRDLINEERDRNLRLTRAAVLVALGHDPVATAAPSSRAEEEVPDRRETTSPSDSPSQQLAALAESRGVGELTGMAQGGRVGELTGSSGLFAVDRATTVSATATREAATRLTSSLKRLAQINVEIHKKYTLAFACLVFVLVGGPLAMRFPGAGLGLVISASSGIFAIYWAGLIGGEALADRLVAPAAVTMWVPNVVFTILGVWLFTTTGREAASTRGGGWDDFFWQLRKRALGLIGRSPGRRTAA